MSKVVFFVLLSIDFFVAQTIYKSNVDDTCETIEAQQTLYLDADNDTMSYVLTIIEYKSGNIGLSLINNWSHREYVKNISSKQYNDYHSSPTMHPISSSKQFTHFIEISINEKFIQTNYQINQRTDQSEHILLHIFCKQTQDISCIVPYDINIEFALKPMRFDDVISLYEDLFIAFKEYKHRSNTEINELKNELQDTQNQVNSLQDVVEAFSLRTVELEKKNIKLINKMNELSSWRPTIREVNCSGSDSIMANCVALCPSDSIIISGGCKTHVDRWHIAQSFKKGNGWYCYACQNMGAGNVVHKSVVGYAYCMEIKLLTIV